MGAPILLLPQLWKGECGGNAKMARVDDEQPVAGAPEILVLRLTGTGLGNMATAFVAKLRARHALSARAARSRAVRLIGMLVRTGLMYRGLLKDYFAAREEAADKAEAICLRLEPNLLSFHQRFFRELRRANPAENMYTISEVVDVTVNYFEMDRTKFRR